MFRVVNKVVVPPGGWRYTQPETRVTLESLTFDGLLYQIESHRKGNGIPLTKDWQLRVELELCQDPDVARINCGAPAQGPPIKDRKVDLTDVLRFMRVINEWGWKTKFKFVKQELAEARASVCETCPMNVVVSGCHGCAGVTRWMEELLPEDRRFPSKNINSCQICGCYLPLKIHIPLEINLKSKPSNAEFPEHCWMETEAP